MTAAGLTKSEGSDISGCRRLCAWHSIGKTPWESADKFVLGMRTILHTPYTMVLRNVARCQVHSV